MRSRDLIRPSFRWLLLAIKDVVFRVSFVCFNGVLGSLGSCVLRRFVFEGVVTSLARFCVWGREKRRSLVSLGWRLVCLLQTPVMADNEQAAAGMSDVASAPPAAEEEIGGRSPLQALEQAGPAESLGRYRIPLKRPLQRSDRADSSSDSNSSWLDSDSDGESGPSVGRQAALVGSDGYRRFDPLAKENDNSWQLPEDMAAYWEAQVSARSDSAARKAIKEVAPAPAEAGLSPAKIDPDILSLLDEGARGPAKAADKALVSLHEALAAVMGPLGQLWQQLDNMRLGPPADPQELLRLTEMAVCLLGQAVWKTVNRRRLLWLARFLGDFKQAALVLEDSEDLPVTGRKLFGKKFLKGLYRKAQGTKQARMIKEVLGAKKKQRKGFSAAKRPFRGGPSIGRGSGQTTWRGAFQRFAGHGQGSASAAASTPQQSSASSSGRGRGRGAAARTSGQTRYVNAPVSDGCRRSVWANVANEHGNEQNRGTVPLGRGVGAALGPGSMQHRPSRGQGKQMFGELESSDLRSRDSITCGRSEAGFCTGASSKSAGKEGPVFQCSPTKRTGSAGGKNVGKRSHRKGGVARARFLCSSVPTSQEGRFNEAYTEPKTSQSVCKISAFQDGRPGGGNNNHSAERLVHQTRPQRRLFCSVSAPQPQKVPQVCVGQEVYQFVSLPFGLASAPRVFTKLLKPVVSLLRRLGMRLVQYLDDGLFMSQDPLGQARDRDTALFVMMKLGFTVNWEKSELNPKQVIEFLGMTIDSHKMLLSLPPGKVQSIKAKCQQLLTLKCTTVRQVAKLVGKIAASVKAVVPGQLFCRQLQMLKTQGLLAQQQNYEAEITLTPECKEELQWWIECLDQHNGQSFLTSVPDMTIRTDASKQGWGAEMDQERTQGVWSQMESKLHINILELRAGNFAVRAFTRGTKVRHVHLLMDNSTAVAYVNNRGGTRSMKLIQEAKELWSYCLVNKITLTAEHLAGRLNVEADLESRQYRDGSNWKLDETIFQALGHIWGPMEMDLFADRLNKQLPAYASWKPDPMAQVTDAFTCNWRKGLLYAFPPFCLISRCLNKALKERAELVLITPAWSTQIWYPQVLGMLADQPVLLPPSPGLLTGPTGDPHPLLTAGRLQLAAWRVSGKTERTQEFLTRQPGSCMRQGGQGLGKLTGTPGMTGLAGVRKGMWIQFRPLWE